jgi:WD40 repeat protein/3',5'-cyclic AMP phosphodiesterase CpdA
MDRLDKTITILHLSDLQFGDNHRFGRLGSPDDTYDRLITRLGDDLDQMKQERRLNPDFVVISGDLMENGKKQEYEAALTFLQSLQKHLNLPADNFILVPGNHDINHALCESFFKECEGNGENVQDYWPYWKKFQWYEKLFQQFYQDSKWQFTAEQPWTLYEYPDKKVVIAGLNSVMDDSHREEDHHGKCGEKQLRYFRDAMQEYTKKDWLRLAVIHHHISSEYAGDEKFVHDFEDLNNYLAPHINLLLHGHVHTGRLSYLNQYLPVIATGSTGVIAGKRPEEIPNQYQFIVLSKSGFTCYTQQYIPAHKRFEGDNRISQNGDQPFRSENIMFQNVEAAFPDDEKEISGEIGRAERELRLPFYRILDDFLERLISICKVKFNTHEVERKKGGMAPEEYLRVTARMEGNALQFPIFACEEKYTQEKYESLREIFIRYFKIYDPGTMAWFVCGGDPPPMEAKKQAQMDNIHLVSYIEFQGLIDLRPYVQKMQGELEKSEIYPPRLYVPQSMEYDYRGEKHREDDAKKAILEWLPEGQQRFILVLGDFGCGKTFLLRELARELSIHCQHLYPIFIEMRSLQKTQDWQQLVLQHLWKAGINNPDISKIEFMLKEGRIVLFFDGFDELALRVSYANAAEHLDTVLKSCIGKARVVLSSRTQHFEDENQIRNALGKQVAEFPVDKRIVRLSPFTEDQIKTFLFNLLGDKQKAEQRFQLLDDIKDLLGLSHNPRMLSFIAEIPEEKLRAAKAKDGEISAAKLYEIILDQWIEFELKRVNPPGAPHGINEDGLWRIVWGIASLLWPRMEKTISIKELEYWITQNKPDLSETSIDPQVLTHMAGSGSLLVRDENGNFGFMHQSILEWLISKEIAESFIRNKESFLLGQQKMSPLMLEFLISLISQEKLVTWAQSAATRENINPMLRANALEVQSRYDKNIKGQVLAGQDLSGQDWKNSDLTQADISGTICRNIQFRQAQMEAADFTGADLQGADFVESKLGKAVFSRADLTGASLLGADCAEAVFHGARMWRAKLIGAKVSREQFMPADLYGAALPWGEPVEPQQLVSIPACYSLCWGPPGSPTEGFIASGHADGNIYIWDMQRQVLLVILRGHEGSVWSVQFSADGRLLASGSDDKSIRLWDVAKQTEAGVLRGHEGSVWSVQFSADGRLLASGSDDKSIRLWDIEKQKELGVLRGHEGYVNSVQFSADGRLLASGSDDKSIRLWDIEKQKELGVLRGHEGYVNSVQFSADGRLLASGSADGSIRLWDVEKQTETGVLRGHEGYVGSVQFSANGRLLASGSDDKSIRLWDVAKQREVGVLRGHKGTVRSVQFSADGGLLASGSDDQSIRLWDVAKQREVGVLRGHEGSVNSVQFSADGRLLASGSGDKSIRLWDVAKQREVGVLRGHEGYVWSVQFSANGRLLASGSDDQSIRLWDIAKQTKAGMLRGHEGSVWSIQFSADGRLLASGSSDQSIRLWDVAKQTEAGMLRGHSGSIYTIQFSADGRILASGSRDQSIRLWDVEKQKEAGVLRGHEGYVGSVQFSVDGRLLASGSDDGSICYWEVSTGKLIYKVHSYHDGWVAFTPDGKYKYQGDIQGKFWFTAGLCRFEPGELDPYAPSIHRVAVDEPLVFLP